MAELRDIVLSKNNLSGKLSTRIGLLSSLVNFDISGNKFHGTIPEEIGYASNLVTLLLDSNQMAGTIPFQINHLSKLAELSMFGNKLTGTIPPIHNLKKLKKLLLGRPSETTSETTSYETRANNLNGTIPSEIGSLVNLRELILSHNNFSGELPSSLENLKRLTKLEIQDNEISGTVSEGICKIFNGTGSFAVDCEARFTESFLKCSCCSQCYGDFSLFSRHGQCPDGEMKIAIVNFQGDSFSTAQCFLLENNFELNWSKFDPGNNFFRAKFGLRDDSDSTILRAGPFGCQPPSKTVYKACVSRTNYFVFTFSEGSFKKKGRWKNRPLSYKIFFNDKLILKGNELMREFGYNANSKFLAEGKDDAIEVCGMNASRGHRSRTIFDELALMSGLDYLINSSTPQYEALCWLIDNSDEHIDENPTSLVQRYVLAVLYHSTNGKHWHNNPGFLSRKHECGWYGITCTDKQMIVQIDLSGNNLDGPLFNEIGELSPLESLHLGDNNVFGEIPIGVANLWSLVELDLKGNKLTGSIPGEIYTLPNLKILNIAQNDLRGRLGNGFQSFSKSKIVEIDLSGNYLTGSIPESISELQPLQKLLLSKNVLRNTIPSSLGMLINLKWLFLDGNKIEGTIPVEISNLINLTELMLQGNELIGSIPTEFGRLLNMVNLSLSHNFLKGAIPYQLANMVNLKLLHLQKNEFSGDVASMPGIESFIADCGSPSIFPSSMLECESCSICCNSLGLCQNNQPLSFEHIEPQWIYLIVLAVCIVCYFLCLAIILLVRKKIIFLPKVHVDIVEASGDDSVYSLLLSWDIRGWFIAIATVVIQSMILRVFLKATDFSEKDDNDYTYPMTCPYHSLDCTDERSITASGWLMFWAVILAHTLSDGICGTKLVYKSVSSGSPRCLGVGFVLIFIALLTIITSYTYNNAIAVHDSDLLMNAVFVLFVTEVDEQLFLVMKSMFPKWLEKKGREAETYSFEVFELERNSAETVNKSRTLPNGPKDAKDYYVTADQNSFMASQENGSSDRIDEIGESGVQHIELVVDTADTDDMKETRIMPFPCDESTDEKKEESDKLDVGVLLEDNMKLKRDLTQLKEEMDQSIADLRQENREQEKEMARSLAVRQKEDMKQREEMVRSLASLQQENTKLKEEMLRYERKFETIENFLKMADKEEKEKSDEI